MKKISPYLIAFFSFSLSGAYVYGKEPVAKPLVPICTQGIKTRCGLMELSGHWRVAPNYSSLQNLSGFWLATQYGLSPGWSTILDAEGKKIATFSYAKKVAENILAARKFNDSLLGLYHYDGTEIAAPRFTDVEEFTDRMAIAKDKSGNTGEIDLQGNWVIPAKFRTIDPFSEGLAGAKDDSGRFGFIDLQGKWVIEPKYLDISPFHQGLATVTTAEMNSSVYAPESVLIDKTGKIITPYRKYYYYLWEEDKYWTASHAITPGTIATVDKLNNQGEVIQKDIGRRFTNEQTPEEHNNRLAIKALIDQLTANKKLTLPEGNKWLSDPSLGNKKYITDILDTQKIGEPQKLPSLFWFNTAPEGGFQSGNITDSLLTDTGGHWLLHYRLVRRVGDTSCQSPISIITDKKGRLIWPADPQLMCQATDPELRKSNREIQQLIAAQEEADIQVQQEVLTTVQPAIAWQHGPLTISLDNIASFTLPAGYRYLPAQEAQSWWGSGTELDKRFIKNDDDHKFIGLISPEKEWWTAVLRLDKHERLNAHALEAIDADQILKMVESRLRQKMNAVVPLQWKLKPEWNKAQQRLTWAIQSQELRDQYGQLNSVKFDNQWMARLQIVVTYDPYNYPWHSDFTYIASQLDELQESIRFAAGQQPLENNATGWDATALITDDLPATEPETAENATDRATPLPVPQTAGNYFLREQKQREEKQWDTIIRTLLHILPILLAALFAAVIGKKRASGQKKDD